MTTPAKPETLPWLINVSSAGDLDISPDGGDMICDLRGCNDAEANAQYIVQACNAFPALYAALECLVRYHTAPDWEDSLPPLLNEARAALSLARGEKGGEVK